MVGEDLCSRFCVTSLFWRVRTLAKGERPRMWMCWRRGAIAARFGTNSWRCAGKVDEAGGKAVNFENSERSVRKCPEPTLSISDIVPGLPSGYFGVTIVCGEVARKDQGI